MCPRAIVDSGCITAPGSIMGKDEKCFLGIYWIKDGDW